MKIGLETHVQLTSMPTKLFCGCDSKYRDLPPNANTCPICLGLPGSLPNLQKEAVNLGLRLATTLHMDISREMYFQRKNYSYPDLPKNFQITQYEQGGTLPVATGGWIEFLVGEKKVKVKLDRIQIEEDPGRLTHPSSIEKSSFTLVDYNRSGMGLIEIVTEPDMHSPDEAYEYLKMLRAILENQNIANPDLEGAMRSDVNVSIKGGNRVEIKNVSSLHEVRRAIEAEVLIQNRLVRREQTVIQQTKHWDEKKRKLIVLRDKEQEQDYRYFPEPNLPKVVLSSEWIQEIQKTMPETLEEKTKRYHSTYNIPSRDVQILITTRGFARLFEDLLNFDLPTNMVANWLVHVLLGFLNTRNKILSETQITTKAIASILEKVNANSITDRVAKSLIDDRVKGKPLTDTPVEGITRIIDQKIIDQFILQVFEQQVELLERVKKNPNVINYILGQVMLLSENRVDHQITLERIRGYLKEHGAL
jgi:aspartyl-tRNA(Asn)/glutamyl-tRNA(Gln) amidotransferase subunit B